MCACVCAHPRGWGTERATSSSGLQAGTSRLPGTKPKPQTHGRAPVVSSHLGLTINTAGDSATPPGGPLGSHLPPPTETLQVAARETLLPEGAPGSWPELPGVKAGLAGVKAGLVGLKAHSRGQQRQDPAVDTGRGMARGTPSRNGVTLGIPSTREQPPPKS